MERELYGVTLCVFVISGRAVVRFSFRLKTLSSSAMFGNLTFVFPAAAIQ
jgi:hypothetical protein